jgi:hypothetical protein
MSLMSPFLVIARHGSPGPWTHPSCAELICKQRHDGEKRPGKSKSVTDEIRAREIDTGMTYLVAAPLSRLGSRASCSCGG